MRGKRSQQGHRAEGGESRAAGWPAILAEWRGAGSIWWCPLPQHRVVRSLSNSSLSPVLSAGATLQGKGRLGSAFATHTLPSWRRQWHPTPVLLPGKSHGWRSLVSCSPWGHEESDKTERLPFHFSLSCIGEGNGNPLQCSCLENPRTAEPGGLPSMGSHRVGHD